MPHKKTFQAKHLLVLLPDMNNISLSLQFQQPTAAPPPPPQPPHTAMLHSVRKPPAKPWKRPALPPPKVYHVEPRGFRKLVQRLTGAPKRAPQPRPLRDTVVPPPPLELAPRALPTPLAFQYSCSNVQTNNYKPPMPPVPSQSLCSPYGRWCSFPLLSPGTMASLDFSISSPIL